MEHGSDLQTQWPSEEEEQDQRDAAFGTAEEDVPAL